jgi:hypothetical protein
MNNSLDIEQTSTECGVGELIFEENCKVVVRVDKCDVREIVACNGTVWRHIVHHQKLKPSKKYVMEMKRLAEEWHLHKPKGIVGFPIAPRQLRRIRYP